MFQAECIVGVFLDCLVHESSLGLRCWPREFVEIVAWWQWQSDLPFGEAPLMPASCGRDGLTGAAFLSRARPATRRR
ncbi:hypothetical protein AZG88_47440 [Rhodococcus sp. LB1]|nr:hypothetical protein AZG88_47440 [Rhodococcus sp. LB1]